VTERRVQHTHNEVRLQQSNEKTAPRTWKVEHSAHTQQDVSNLYSSLIRKYGSFVHSVFVVMN